MALNLPEFFQRGALKQKKLEQGEVFKLLFHQQDTCTIALKFVHKIYI